MLHHDRSIHQMSYNVGYCLPATTGISQRVGIQLAEPDQKRALFKREAQHTEPKNNCCYAIPGLGLPLQKHGSFEIIRTMLGEKVHVVIKIRGPYNNYLNLIGLVSRCAQLWRSNRKAGYS
jgi:hypothetical protein